MDVNKRKGRIAGRNERRKTKVMDERGFNGVRVDGKKSVREKERGIERDDGWKKGLDE